ncbi:MAG: hypothetical protein AB1Z98_19110 [Nannocystaceae bacterium]
MVRPPDRSQLRSTRDQQRAAVGADVIATDGGAKVIPLRGRGQR